MLTGNMTFIQDLPEPNDPPPADPMAALLADVRQSERRLAMEAAVRAKTIDDARQQSERTRDADFAASPFGGERSGWAAFGARWNAKTLAYKVLITELACALRVAERRMEALVAHSATLMHRLPLTLAALREGRISYWHAEILIDQVYSLPEESWAAFEEALVLAAEDLTGSKLRRKATIWRERHHPDSITARRVKAEEDRALTWQPGQDGMGWLIASVPLPVGEAIYAKCTDIATGLQGPDESRTLEQLRVDAFTDQLIDNVHPGGPGIRATVHVTVPVLTLMGLSDEPGELEGCGPIDAETARKLAGTATSFRRILVHPVTGAVLSIDRTRYAVPRDLKVALRVRDETCRFPGCNRSAKKSDLDHTIAWEDGGGTNHDNLAHLCPKHHKIKHVSGWGVSQIGDGVLKWVAPSGLQYETRPAVVIPVPVPAPKLGELPPF